MSEPVVGIDLGTTNSVLATVDQGRPKVIPNRAGSPLTPSMVGFLPDGERVVGEGARLLANEQAENVAYATKRFIGRRWTPELAAEARSIVPYALVGGPNGEIRIKFAGRTLPVTQIGAMVLGELRLDAQFRFGRPVSKAVVTVPANFDDAQRQATKEAARIAGFDVLRIINEPTAAALAYGLSRQFDGRALVFDLGGGTFDVSILEVQEGVFEVKATGGDSRLGGEDFDNRIAQWLLAQLPDHVRDAAAKDKPSMQRLKIAAEKAKRELSTSMESLIQVTGIGDHASGKKEIELETALTRSFFETLSEPLSRRCLAVCEKVMSEARLDPKSVDALLLVGGMTRVPLIRQLVAEFFGKEPVAGVDPDLVVALGAAIHAAEVAGESNSALLIDVASHSLGVGVLGGGVRRLVAKNTPIPASHTEVFLPSRSGQTEACIEIFQGESDRADEDTKLGQVVLSDLRVVFRAETPIDVTFELSSEGTLSVRATDVSSGLSEALRIEARTQLSSSEVEHLSREQSAYAAVRSKEDEAANADAFRRMIDGAEKYLRLLERSAEENPSPDADAAVATVKSLLSAGIQAFESRNAKRMSEISARLGVLTRGK